jgi:glycosyltransferase involved in cell wall biosynthesis
MGSSLGSFFYDYACLKDALRNEHFDIIYEAGYTTIIPAYIRFNVKAIKSPIFVTNMDGLEYKRAKFNKLVQKFVYWEEQMAVKYSQFLIADNMGIHDYYKEHFGRESKFLAYGANIYDNYSEEFLKEYGLERNQYLLIVARLEPENNLSMAIEGYIASEIYGKIPLVIVGKKNTPHGKHLVNTYSSYEHIRFTSGIYNFDKLNSLRYFSYAYFHGHSVGGTNPSLLEAMASECFILSHDNIFNKTVLGDNAIYYSDKDEVTNLLNKLEILIRERKQLYTTNNLEVIRTQYSWEKLVEEHEEYFMSLFSKIK